VLLAGRGPCSQLHAGVTAQTKHILYEPTCLGTSISQRRLSECIARMAPPHREQAGVVSSGGVSPWCDGCTKEPAKMPRFPSKPAPSLVCAVFIPLPSAQVSLTHPRIKQKNCGEKKKKQGHLKRWTCSTPGLWDSLGVKIKSVACRGKKRAVKTAAASRGSAPLPAAAPAPHHAVPPERARS